MERTGYLPGRESATFSTGLPFLELARHKGLILLAANNVTLASLRVIEQSIVNPSEVTCGTDLRTVGEPAGFAHAEHKSRSSNSARGGGDGSCATEPACLVLHGLGGGPYELQPLIAALEAAGLQVLAPIMPGHDGPGPKCRARAGATGRRRLNRRSTGCRPAAGKLPSLGFRPAARWRSTSRVGGPSCARYCSRPFSRFGTADSSPFQR